VTGRCHLSPLYRSPLLLVKPCETWARRSILDAGASDIDAAVWLSARDDMQLAGLGSLLYSDDLGTKD